MTCDAAPDADWRELPVKVSVEFEGYEPLDFEVRASDPTPAHRLEPE